MAGLRDALFRAVVRKHIGKRPLLEAAHWVARHPGWLVVDDQVVILVEDSHRQAALLQRLWRIVQGNFYLIPSVHPVNRTDLLPVAENPAWAGLERPDERIGASRPSPQKMQQFSPIILRRDRIIENPQNGSASSSSSSSSYPQPP